MFKNNLSLPTRLSLAVVAVLVLTTATADLLAMRALRKTLAGSVSASLSGMVRRMGEQLDADVAAMLALASGEADLLEGKTAKEAQEFLLARDSALAFAFDYGVLLVGDEGQVLADSRGRDWRDSGFADEEFFQRTFARGCGLASEPFVSPAQDGTPMVAFTAPVRDGEGRMTGVLAGMVDVRANRILNQPTGIRTGRYGQIGLFTRDGRVVAHTEKRFLLERYENPLPERPPENGVMEITDTEGHAALLAVARLRQADWVLAGVFAAVEVYAPVEQGFEQAHVWFGLGLLASGLLAWVIAGRSVRDLGLLAGEVEGIGEGKRIAGMRVGTEYRGEAGKMGGAVNHMLGSLEGAQAEIDDLSNRLAESAERERRSVAADLHDSVCQNLALANMRLGGLKKCLADPDAVKTVEEIRGIVEQAVGEARSLTFNLSPGILYELGLGPALEWYAGEFSKKYGVAVETRLKGDFSGMREGLAIFLYRAAGELLTNAAKHGRPEIIELNARRDGDTVVLRVLDDGVGMEEGEAGGGGFGLRHMRERARRLGGGVVLSRREGGGTEALLRVPFHGEEGLHGR